VSLLLTPVDAAGPDREELIAFLTSQTFPFHVRSRPTRRQVEANIADGTWGGGDVESFWIDDGNRGRVGLLRLDDLADWTAMIDLRLAEQWRGHGIGTLSLNLATDHVFLTRPAVMRLEGQTREDNIAMQRTFDKSGWVREAYYRDGWPVEGGVPMASVAYSVLRRDWLSGVTTPVPSGPGVTLSGELRCADEDEAALVRAFLPEHVARTRAEPGCLSFDVDPTADALTWRVDERFIDEAAFDAHQRRVAASVWGSATAGIARAYVIRGRAQDAGAVIAEAWAAEERLLDPAVRSDPAGLRRLLADDFAEIGRSGRWWTRDEIIAALTAEEPGSRPPSIERRQSRLLDADTVLLTYLLRGDDRASYRSSVWRCDPQPRCLFHQGTVVPG